MRAWRRSSSQATITTARAVASSLSPPWHSPSTTASLQARIISGASGEAASAVLSSITTGGSGIFPCLVIYRQ